MKKYTILIHLTGISLDKERLIAKNIINSGDTIPNPIDDRIGCRDINNNNILDFSFLDSEQKERRIIIVTTSDNIIRQINLAILKGSLEEKENKKLSILSQCPGIHYRDINAYWIDQKEITQLNVSKTGNYVPEFEAFNRELNDRMEEMYYRLKYKN